MEISASSKVYQVHFGENFEYISKLEIKENMYFVIDKKVYELYSELFQTIDKNRFYLLEAVEENKTIEKALEICEQVMQLNAKRNSHLISVGGGITQDVTGFVANILYRGIYWTFIPTTLLAACDSCIGGKTSLNYKHYKNLLGTFFPPDDIYIYPEFFKTLSDRDFYSGMGEVVKFNIMRGFDNLKKTEEDFPLLLSRDVEKVKEYVYSSLEFKKRFIEEDEFDRGKRVLLNFAHTFGHAIETITRYEIPHGAAVAIGTLMANHISCERGYISGEEKLRMENVISGIVKMYSLPEEFSLEHVIEAIKKDKKQRDDNMTVVLFVNSRLELKVCHDLQREELEQAIRYIKGILNKEGE